jgi:hypothetical protein
MQKIKQASSIIFILLLIGCGKSSPEQDASRKRLYAISFAQNAIEQTLKDPSSIEYITKAYNLDNDALCFKYRARNSFGGMVVNQIVIKDEKVHESASSFSKFCNGNLERY